MERKILKVGFDVIQENIRNNNFESRVLVFDNFTEPIEDFEFLSLNNGPIRINTIIIAFCTAGHVKFSLGVKPVEMSKNMLVVIHPDQIVETTEISPDFKVGFIVLQRNFFEIQNDYMKAITLHNFFLEHAVFLFSEENMQEYMVMYGLMKKKIEERDNIYRMQIIQNFCHIMFYNISNVFYHSNMSKSEKKKSNSTEIYERFIKCVEMNYRTEHSVQYYADVLCLSPKYMSSVVYEVTGKHASEWIQEFIMLEAKALLKSTKMSLQEINDILNFPSQSHFGRFFKRYSGFSPREYRNL